MGCFADFIRQDPKRELVHIACGQCDAALYFPSDFADRAKEFQQSLADHLADDPSRGGEPPAAPEIPGPTIVYAHTEKSLQARERLNEVLWRWRNQIGRMNLVEAGLPERTADPFRVESVSLSGKTAETGGTEGESALLRRHGGQEAAIRAAARPFRQGLLPTPPRGCCGYVFAELEPRVQPGGEGYHRVLAG